MPSAFDGLDMNLGTLARFSEAQTRSISAENPTGEKGKGGMAAPLPGGPARELGVGWKCRPFITVKPGETTVIADIKGPGAIQSMWFGSPPAQRDFILRIYWDGQQHPSVECPLPDFFGMHFLRPGDRDVIGPLVTLNSLPVCVNPNRGQNCFWLMPFHKHCRMTLENRNPDRELQCYYQVNYTLGEVPQDVGYFHAQFRRVNPLPYMQVYNIVDIVGKGHYVGTMMGWSVNNNNWWGEGEIKFFIDGDTDFPTICGTGTEDYFGGSYNWEVDGKYVTYSTPFMGMHQVIRPDGLYNAQQRHGMYRWHIMDPVRFLRDLKVTIQALGWRSEFRFLPGMHDICSVAFWYQTLPAAPFPRLPDRNGLEVI